MFTDECAVIVLRYIRNGVLFPFGYLPLRQKFLYTERQTRRDVGECPHFSGFFVNKGGFCVY